jgi:LacI family transcriptional regulator
MVSISEVAAKAQVSETTVSHALSGRRPVSRATLAKVEAAVTALGYRPNLLASGLRKLRTQTMALIVPDISNPFYPAVARGIQDTINPEGYQCFICSTGGSIEAERGFIANALDRQVDGIVFAPSHASEDGVDLISGSRSSLVLLSGAADLAGHDGGDYSADVVRSDDEGGMARATRHLIARGHRRIGFINAPLDEGPARRRLAGFQVAMTEAGLPVHEELVVARSFTRVGGAEGLTQLLDSGVPPTAVLCANDLIAIGALDVARARGLRVPEDIAIVGFDDIDAASLVYPALTTVVNPAFEVGAACARLLLERMSEQYTGPGRHVIIETELVLRASA